MWVVAARPAVAHLGGQLVGGATAMPCAAVRRRCRSSPSSRPRGPGRRGLGRRRPRRGSGVLSAHHRHRGEIAEDIAKRSVRGVRRCPETTKSMPAARSCAWFATDRPRPPTARPDPPHPGWRPGRCRARRPRGARRCPAGRRRARRVELPCQQGDFEVEGVVVVSADTALRRRRCPAAGSSPDEQDDRRSARLRCQAAR